MEFANGFEEEDDPILPPIAAAAPPAAPRFIPKRRNRAVVDLTDSPPPSTTSLPSFETEEGAEASGVPVASGSGTTKRKERIPPLPSSTNGFQQHAAQGTPSRASGSGASGSESGGFAAYASASPSSTYRSIAPSSNAQAGSSRPIQHAPVASLGSIPIINSASTARLPSAYLTALSKSGAEAHNPRPQAAAGSSKGAMGKGKDAIIDLTTSDAEEDDDEIIVDDTPICIGQLTTVALILYPIPEIQLPSQSSSSSGSFAPPTSVTPPLRVHIWREQPQGHNQTLKLLTTRGKETFGVMEHKVANVLAPLLGEGLVGTGVAGKGEGRGPDGAKVWCVANLIRRGEKNVSTSASLPASFVTDDRAGTADDATTSTPPLRPSLPSPTRLRDSLQIDHLPRTPRLVQPRRLQRVQLLEPSQPRRRSLGTRRCGETEGAAHEWDLWGRGFGRDDPCTEDGRGAEEAGRRRAGEFEEWSRSR